MSEDTSIKELGKAHELTADTMWRTIVSEMFTCDNDKTRIVCKLKGVNDEESVIEFDIKLVSINGVLTGDDE